MKHHFFKKYTSQNSLFKAALADCILMFMSLLNNGFFYIMRY